MNAKKFLLGGIAGGITDFLLGWLFYGMLFREYFGGKEPNIVLIFCGCMAFGFLISYIWVRWANLVTFTGGLQAGAVIGLIMGIMNNCFMWSMQNPVEYEKFAMDVVICLIIGAIVGGVVAAVNGALSRNHH
ncbi:MAG TPA: hypothetical protein VGB43_05590 [Flavobacterium sp.]|jgi:riboflavin transporter FmnP